MRHKEVAVALLKDEHPDAVESVRPVPSLVPGVACVEELAHTEALSSGPAVLTISLTEELDIALAAPLVPGRCHRNNPIRAAMHPAAMMRTVRRMMSTFGTNLDLVSTLGIETLGLSAANFSDRI